MLKKTLSALLLGSVAMTLHASEGTTQLEKVSVVEEAHVYRNRVDTNAPTLVYDRRFFERFEPMTVGDMLKRVPGVVFQGDIGEYDEVRFRGMETEYTQILVNGKRIPGAGDGRGVMVDRIPAEMIDRIEILRSPSASNDAQGVAGTINIILKPAAKQASGTVRLGMSYHDVPVGDAKTRNNAYASYGDHLDGMSYEISAFVQQRYNAKDKTEKIFDDERAPKESNRERDVRDSTDLALQAMVDVDVLSSSTLNITGKYLRTDRHEEEHKDVYEFEDDGSKKFDKTKHQIEVIDQESWGVASELSLTEWEHEWKLGLYVDIFNEDKVTTEEKISDEVAFDGREDKDVEDQELKLSVANIRRYDAHKLQLGAEYQTKNRDMKLTAIDDEYEDDSDPNGVYEIKETRMDLYAEDIWSLTPSSTLQAGVRFENTQIDQTGQDGAKSDTDFSMLHPSLHFNTELTPNDRIRASLAQTVRRATFKEMIPYVKEDKPNDDDEWVGNPELEPEVSLGLDAGYEHAFGNQQGIIGVNFFYRSVRDVIEAAKIGTNTKGGNRYSPENSGDGAVYGAEFDASFPLNMVGLEGVSVFANYTMLDSEIDDPYTGKERRFNGQPEYVYNVGMQHTVRSWGFSYGFSYQVRGESYEEFYDESEKTEYDPNLEAYVEYDVSKTLKLRLTGNNLLDAEVREYKTKYDSLNDKLDGKVDEYENEVEKSGALYMLTLRGAF